MTDISSIIYKYSDWKNKYHREMLLINKIFFSSARHFNDPFDCRNIINFFDGPEEDRRLALMENIRNTNPHLDMKEQLVFVDDVEKNIKYILKNTTERERKENLMQESIYNNAGVFSMSESNDNILLWSHYSDSHKGFCVGFDTEKLIEYVKNDCLSKGGDRYANLFPVKYIDNYSEQTIFNDAQGLRNALIDSLTIKYKDWAYEREIRLIILNDTDYSLSLPDDVVVSICFGLEISQEHKEQIWESIKQRSNHPKVFQAKRRKKAFGLEFEELSY